MRDGALISLKHKDMDLEKREVWQDPKHVKTKNHKGITSQFIPIDCFADETVVDWLAYSRDVLSMIPDEPLFPKQLVANNPAKLSFEVIGLSREHWAYDAPVREIFHKAFVAAGLPKCQPHTVRSTIAIWGWKTARSFSLRRSARALATNTP